jgi:hypothetical protein
MQALAKLTTTVGGQRRIISDPPLIVPVENLWEAQASVLAGYCGRGGTPRWERTTSLDRDF